MTPFLWLLFGLLIATGLASAAAYWLAKREENRK